MAHLFETQEQLQFQSFDYGQQQQQQQYSSNAAEFSNYSYPQNNQSSHIQQQQPTSISWRAAFSSGDYPDEPPLLEELGINFGHMRDKAISVLNPFTPINKHIFDESDLAGPVLFCLLYGGFQLFAGKIQFNFIYAVALLGWLSIHAVLNLMSENGMDSARTASVLGYCFLPMVLLSSLSILLHLSGTVGLVMSIVSVCWCTYSASLMFVTVLSMSEQRLLVAYPVGLLYSAFALLVVMAK
ncbi:hypothetical protein HDU78_009823 [Chytriomyces hyalinus]|nr:hypothetical protein HDU78_009823 [Chytriomyces hyalinus]